MHPKLETLLVGVDLTAPSLEGAEWVARAFAPEARVVLAHTIEAHPLRRFFSVQVAQEKAERMRADAAERLENLRLEVGADRTKVVVTDGDPGTRLAEIADEEGANLIAVGGYREKFAGGLLGTVVSTLLGASTIPLLITHALPEGPPKRALVAVDESDSSKRVLEWARALAEAFDLEGRVVSAIEPGGVAVNTTLFSSDEEYRQAREQVVESTRRRIEIAARDAGLGAERFEVLAFYGRPEQEILAAAEELGAELLILGSRGYGHGRTLMMGSVSRRVTEASNCPVLIVPPESKR
ncbi:MAG: universal stress protein [Gemmatimonadota bacterium]